MNAATALVLACVIAAAGAAVWYLVRHRGDGGCGCGGCDGCPSRGSCEKKDE